MSLLQQPPAQRRNAVRTAANRHVRNSAALLRRVAKPEYVYRPSQIARRLARGPRSHWREEAVIDLPWGHRLIVRPGDDIGSALWRFGVYDLLVTELIWCLGEFGDQMLDIGANIGYMSSVMSGRIGPDGRVYAFEPIPSLFNDLTSNISLWPFQNVTGRPFALSDRTGDAEILLPRMFERNHGIATLQTDTPFVLDGVSERLVIQAVRYDDLDESRRSIGVAKIDVEGHELHVLRGAARSLDAHRIRDLIYEDHTDFPNETSRLLEDFGYTIFTTHRTFGGARIHESGSGERSQSGFDPPSMLATLDPTRAKRRLSHRGWAALSSRIS